MSQTVHSSARPLALVTGASAGIGYALARHSLQNGFDVVITGASPRVHASREQLADEAPKGAAVFAVQSDLRTAQGVATVWDAVDKTGADLEAAMLNAGVAVGGAFVDTDLQEEVDSIELNVVSQVRLAKPIVRDMVRRGRGRIMFTSSISATTPTPYETTYGPAKAFIYSFAQSLRHELLDTGVSVTVLLPGATATEFHQRAGMGNTAFGDNSWKTEPALVAQLGFEAMMAGRDQVVGGDADAERVVEENRRTPDPVKAARQAEMTRPR